MTEGTKWLTAARALFRKLSGHGYEVTSYDDFWSNHSNSTMLGTLRELCEYFNIDDVQLEQFAIATRKCDYCGVNKAPKKDENGEHVCSECLAKSEEEQS